MNKVIQQRLREIEKTQKCVVFFAVEAGSRAWGMESQDSDYDVRFVYNRPDAQYQMLLSQSRDIIEHKDGDLDIVGWDVRKALKLLRKSNISMLEHLRSPIIYTEFSTLRRDLLELAERQWSPRVAALHHLGLAEGHYRKYMKFGAETKLKHALYCLRSVLSAFYMFGNSNLPPVNFQELINHTGTHILNPLANELLAKKLGNESESEKYKIPHDLRKCFDGGQFFELKDQAIAELPTRKFPDDELEKLFKEVRRIT